MNETRRTVPDSKGTGSRKTESAVPISSTERATSRALPVPDEPLIDIRALAAWLSVSEHTVRKWTAKGPESGLIPRFIRINGQVRFRPADVRAYLVNREVG
jgi:predicted DNA-binding transcriptional regulator AlpA